MTDTTRVETFEGTHHRTVVALAVAVLASLAGALIGASGLLVGWLVVALAALCGGRSAWLLSRGRPQLVIDAAGFRISARRELWADVTSEFTAHDDVVAYTFLHRRYVAYHTGPRERRRTIPDAFGIRPTELAAALNARRSAQH